MKILIIQTAFPGDVILATSLAEKLQHHFPHARLDFLVRKGNESILSGNPFISEILCRDKKSGVLRLAELISKIRKENYDKVINLHRFFSSGLITVLSGAKETRGFDKNPLSFLFTKKFQHSLEKGIHEIERNHMLIKDFTDEAAAKPVLYPLPADYEKVKSLKAGKYVCIAPASVWFTKQLPESKWVELIANLSPSLKIYLLGSASDAGLCKGIAAKCNSDKVEVLAGSLSFLQSAALMKDAQMNYVNDSAPQHIASAMNAAVTSFFCSTVPRFGFGPLSENSTVIETNEKLDCKPCGIHGFKACPQKHFRCALTIDMKEAAI